MMKSSTVLALLLLAATTSELSQAASKSNNLLFAHRGRQQNFVDPIYAFDDIDAHTVSLTNSNSPAAAAADGSSTPRGTPTSGPTTSAPTVVSSFVAAKKDSSDAANSDFGPGSSAANRSSNSNQKRASPFEELSALATPKAATAAAAAASDGPKFEPPANVALVVDQPRLAAAQFNQDGLESIAVLQALDQVEQRQRKPAAEKHHWSGLENYYKLIRPTYQRLAEEPSIYQISQEPAHADDQLNSGGNQHWSHNGRPIVLQPGYHNPAEQLPATYGPPAPHSSGFAFDLKSQTGYELATTKRGPQQLQIGNTDLLQTTPAHSYHSVPPPRPTMTIVQSNVYDRDTNQDLRTMSRDELLRLLEAQRNRQQPQQQQQQTEQRRYPQAEFLLPAVWDHQRQERPTLIRSSDGRLVQQEATKVQDYLEIQRQQQRHRHQMETFGTVYDSQRLREQYQEDMYCRASQVNIRLAPSNATSSAGGQIVLSAEQLGRLSQMRIDPSSLLAHNGDALNVEPAFGEFPSHMGLYNGTPGEDNFLCGATWIQDGFALTLATCVDSVSPQILSVRFGEWTLNKPSAPANASGGQPAPPSAAPASTFTGRIKEIIIFPKYNKNDSLEHNLALLRLESPIDFMQIRSYASPACQKELRNAHHQTKSCWAPVRNITMGEYFDAEGEAETKERKNVAMIELPVKLFADDDPDCLRQSGLNPYNHPHYICSADYRKAAWRAKLNQSDYFGSGIYCNEAGILSLVSMIHPLGKSSTTAVGYIDLSYYRSWMRSVIYGSY